MDDVYQPPDGSNSVAPGMQADALMRKISKTGRRKYLVTDRGRLLGVITLTDLTGYRARRQGVRRMGGKGESA